MTVPPYLLAAEELALPRVWESDPPTIDTARFDWYTRRIVESDLVKGGVLVIPELVAAMFAESGLVNFDTSANALSGTAPTSPGFVSLGVGWMRLDTAWHVDSIGFLHELHADPMTALLYCVETPDLTWHGGHATHFNKSRWHAWKRERIDPPAGFNPLRAAHDAWDRRDG